jgi:serine/threonine protein phosphatase PrpC
VINAFRIQLTSDDEFIILGCDGIWDCLTNEKAVEYVMERINTKSLTDIGIEMLNFIISDDPKLTQGIGGDNMTVLIVDLKPHTRNINDNMALVEPSQKNEVESLSLAPTSNL